MNIKQTFEFYRNIAIGVKLIGKEKSAEIIAEKFGYSLGTVKMVINDMFRDTPLREDFHAHRRFYMAKQAAGEYGIL